MAFKSQANYHCNGVSRGPNCFSWISMWKECGQINCVWLNSTLLAARWHTAKARLVSKNGTLQGSCTGSFHFLVVSLHNNKTHRYLVLTPYQALVLYSSYFVLKISLGDKWFIKMHYRTKGTNLSILSKVEFNTGNWVFTTSLAGLEGWVLDQTSRSNSQRNTELAH